MKQSCIVLMLILALLMSMAGCEKEGETDTSKTAETDIKPSSSSSTVGSTSESSDISVSTTAAPQKQEGVNVGDYIRFGTYEQDNNWKNGEEAIEWLVLAKEDDKMLVISRYGIDCRAYNPRLKQYNDEYTSWEECVLRSWMNTTFYEAAFSTVEQDMILESPVKADKNPKYETDAGNDTNDKVFLLSVADVERYLSSETDRICQGTAYCFAQGAEKSDGDVCYWWLRSPGSKANFAANILDNGSLFNDFAYATIYAIRPAVWVSMDAFARYDYSKGSIEKDTASIDKGIVVVNATFVRMNASEYTVKLDILDVETGKYKTLRVFKNPSDQQCSAYLGLYPENTETVRENFSNDYRYMTAVSGSHVGWVDEEGVFTDVSSLITVQSDFNGTIKHDRPKFFGDYFYFRDKGTNEVCRVPVNNLTLEAVEKVTGDDVYVLLNDEYYINADGSVSGEDQHFKLSKINKKDNSYFFDWISEEEYVCSSMFGSIIYSRSISDGVKGKELVSKVTGRTNLYPVADPDGKQIAFLSYLETDRTANLFVIPAEGGEPRKISTNYPFLVGTLKVGTTTSIEDNCIIFLGWESAASLDTK